MPWTIADIPRLDNRTALITGVGGLGYEAGLALARAGAHVVLAGRNPAKGAASLARIRTAVPASDIRFELLDLASLASIAALADRLRAEGRPIHMLINNAGLMAGRNREITADGMELQFGTNYLGHFALTAQLLPLLLKTERPRVVNVSSLVHKQGAIRFDDLQWEHRYKANPGYAQSKLAMLIFALELDRRAKAAGSLLESIPAHPGVARTDMFFDGPGSGLKGQFINHVLLPFVSHPAPDGALPLLFAATSPDAKSGHYYGPDGFLELKGPPAEATVAPRALDEEAGRRLWEASETLARLQFHF